MPNVPAVGAGAAEEDVPLLNAEATGSLLPDSPGASACSTSPKGWLSEEEQAEEPFPREEGCCYDDPLWFGKTPEQIRSATELEKADGNAASREADWKRASRCWKNALRGAEKLQDKELELCLRLNLALGYTRRKKTDKALEHCSEVLGERLNAAASSELRTKAHFRCAEAHEAAGEESKAISSLKAALDIEPENMEVRRRLAQLRRRESERRGRERDIFHGKLLRAAGAGPGAGAAETPRTTLLESSTALKVGVAPDTRASPDSSVAPDASAALDTGAALDPASTALARTLDRAPAVASQAGCTAARRLAGKLAGGTLGGDEVGAGQQDDEAEVGMPGLNMEVGPPLELFGPLRLPASADGPAEPGQNPKEDGVPLEPV